MLNAVYFVGLDLAWGPANRTGIAISTLNLAEDQIDAVLRAYIAMFFTTHANSSPMIHLLEP